MREFAVAKNQKPEGDYCLDIYQSKRRYRYDNVKTDSEFVSALGFKTNDEKVHARQRDKTPSREILFCIKLRPITIHPQCRKISPIIYVLLSCIVL
jgi:hypothetical protein